jgi:hypothetical protein
MNTPTLNLDVPTLPGSPISPRRQSWPRRLWGSMLTFVGFMLSPLSWWNDLVVNLPLALAFAWVVALIHPPAFQPAVVVGYGLTIVLAFVLMHIGLGHIRGPRHQRCLRRDLGIAVLYTAVVLVMVHLGMLQPVEAALLAR